LRRAIADGCGWLFAAHACFIDWAAGQWHWSRGGEFMGSEAAPIKRFFPPQHNGGALETQK
jgi:hypothetical protein